MSDYDGGNIDRLTREDLLMGQTRAQFLGSTLPVLAVEMCGFRCYIFARRMIEYSQPSRKIICPRRVFQTHRRKYTSAARDLA